MLLPPVLRRWIFHNYATGGRRQTHPSHHNEAEAVQLPEEGTAGAGNEHHSIPPHEHAPSRLSLQSCPTSEGSVVATPSPAADRHQAGQPLAEGVEHSPVVDDNLGVDPAGQRPSSAGEGGGASERSSARRTLLPGSQWAMVQQAVRDGRVGNLTADKQYSVVRALIAAGVHSPMRACLLPGSVCPSLIV